MALTFGVTTSSRVNHGSATVLDNLDPFTVIMWMYPTTLTNGRRPYTKGAQNTFSIYGTAGDLSFERLRTTSTIYTTNNTPLATLNKWYFVAFSFNSAGATGQIVNIYVGNLSTFAVEATYGTATDGSGSLNTDATANLIIGNRPVADSAFQGRIAWVGVWNRELTLGELRAQQFRPHKTSGCVLFTHYGFNGTGTQPDWSGSGNPGTVTDATVSSHVPLGYPFIRKPAGWIGNFTVVVGAGGDLIMKGDGFTWVLDIT